MAQICKVRLDTASTDETKGLTIMHSCEAWWWKCDDSALLSSMGLLETTEWTINGESLADIRSRNRTMISKTQQQTCQGLVPV